MDLVEVDVVHPQPLQRAVDGRHDVLARQAAAVGVLGDRVEHLGGDHHLFAPGQLLDRAAEHGFALATRIHVGGIEEVDAVLDGPLVERAAGGFVQDPRPPVRRAVGHGAETEPRDFQARWCQGGRSPLSLLHVEEVRDRQERQRACDHEGAREAVVLAQPADGNGAGADAGVKGANQRAEGGAAAIVGHVVHQVGDEDRIGGPKADAKQQRRRRRTSPRVEANTSTEMPTHHHAEARHDHLGVADPIGIAAEERPRAR